MGSKKLKAVVVRGNQKVPIADIEAANRLRREYIVDLKSAKFREGSFFDRFHKYGTTFLTVQSAYSGDTPVKNWDGVGVTDFPDTEGLSGDAAIANKDKPESCWQCPLTCQALLKEGTGEYKYQAGVRRPEYETQALS